MKLSARLLSPALLLTLIPACDSDGETPDQPAASDIEDSISVHPVITADVSADDADDSDSSAPSAGDAFAGNSAVEQLPGFDMGVALADNEKDVILDWDDQDGAVSYSIWRTQRIPYFYPGMVGADMIASGVTDTTYTDATGFASASYYYIVQADNGATSTTVGKFVNKMEGGYNKVSQPLITGITSGLEFGSSFADDEAWGNPYLWKPEQQRYIRARPNKDFIYGPGQCPIVRHRWKGKKYSKRSVGHVPHYGEMDMPLYQGHNYVTVPLWYGDLMASELLENLPEDAAIAYFTQDGPSDPYTNDGGEDFLIHQGDCVAITLTDDAAWPPPQDAKDMLSTTWNHGVPDDYTPYNEADASYYVEDGSLHMDPSPNSVWHGNNEGFHLSQPISGDFAITTSIVLTDGAGDEIVNGQPWNIGGIMIRDAEETEGPTNFHVGVGNADLTTPQLEAKSTRKGSSGVQTYPWTEYKAKLRICRVGETVQALVYDDDAEAWSVLRTVNRADLGEELEAGPIAYADVDEPDFHVRNKYVNVMTINTLADCVLDELPYGQDEE